MHMRYVALYMVIASMVVSPTLASAISLTRPIAIGSTGDDVAAVQKILQTLGYFKLEVTGYFGRATNAAVAKFQSVNGLAPVGSVGPKTRALINARLSVVDAKSPQTSISTSAPPIFPTIAPSVTAIISSSSTVPIIETSTDAAPTINILTPSLLPANTREIILTVSTDRDATCRYGTTQNIEFPRKTAFSNTGGTVHTNEFLNLGNGNLYIYYVQCESTKNLKLSTEAAASFKVSQPSAYISLPLQVAAAAKSAAYMGPWSLTAPLQMILEANVF